MSITELEIERKRQLDSAHAIVDAAKAADRDLTDTEYARVDAIVAGIKELDAKLERGRKSAERVQAIGGLGPNESHYSGRNGTTPGRLRLGGLKAAITSGMLDYSRKVSPGVKGLVPSGEVRLPIDVTPGGMPVTSDPSQERAPRLTDVLPALPRDPVYSWLKQSVIANSGGAAVVAPGDVKPTKKLGARRVEDRLRVIAVLSEPVDRFLLEDVAQLTQWVGLELVDAVELEIERQVIDGDGTGENFAGLSATSGVLVQAYTADALTTVRYGLGRLEDAGITPAFIALSSQDWLAISTRRNPNGAFDLGGPIDATARTAWGVRVATVPGLEPGGGYVVGTDAVELAVDRAGVRIEWGTPGDTFTRNQVVARVETRANLAVMRPHAIVEVQLTGTVG